MGKLMVCGLDHSGSQPFIYYYHNDNTYIARKDPAGVRSVVYMHNHVSNSLASRPGV